MLAISASTGAAAERGVGRTEVGGSRVGSMKPTIEAEVDENGNIRPKEPVSLPPGSQLLITVLGRSGASETALLSEASLAADWNRPEEDAAWAGLEPA